MDKLRNFEAQATATRLPGWGTRRRALDALDALARSSLRVRDV